MSFYWTDFKGLYERIAICDFTIALGERLRADRYIDSALQGPTSFYEE